ncbi:MAG: hypothetical protein R3C05_05320 [Pirellulaceae bacterium]
MFGWIIPVDGQLLSTPEFTYLLDRVAPLIIGPAEIDIAASMTTIRVPVRDADDLVNLDEALNQTTLYRPGAGSIMECGDFVR